MFQGTGIALVTPFKEDLSIDYNALSQIIESVIAGGVEFLVALGTTAETPTLSSLEKREVLDFIIKQNNKRLPLVVGIGGNHTQEVIDTIAAYPLQQVDAILSVVPYYNRPGQEAIYQHFKAIAQSTDKAIILYNVPSRTSANMNAATTLRLAKDFRNIIAIKEASGSIPQCMELMEGAPEGFTVLSGDDDLSLAQMALGFKGVISVAGNCFPRAFSDMIRLAAKNDFPEARNLHYRMRSAIQLLFAEGNPTGVKAMLALQGKCGNKVRLPLLAASDTLKDQLSAFIKIS